MKMPFMEIGEKLREILMFTDGVFRTRLDQMIDLHSLAALAADKIGKEVCFSINRAALETRLGNVLDYLKENT